MTDRIQDLTDFETLPLYDVAKHMAAETRPPLTSWLYRIIKGGVIVCLNHYAGNGAMFDIEMMDQIAENPLPSEEDYSVKLIRVSGFFNRFSNNSKVPTIVGNEKPEPHIRTLKEQLKEITINREHFRAWCESQEYPLPKFWFGDIAQTGQTPAEKRKRLDESTRQQAEEYALQERKRGTAEPEIVLHIQDTYGFRGVKLHDIIWPEKKEIEPSTKNVNLTRMRNKARDK